MNGTQNRRQTPSYGRGFGGLPDLAASDATRRWYSEKSPLFAAFRTDGRLN